MKKIIVVTLLVHFFWINDSFSQSEIGNIAFSLVMPDEIDGFDQNQITMLESKIIQATTAIGIAGKGFYSDFILYPVVTLNEIESHSQNMKNTVSFSIELGIFVKSVADGRIFSSYSIVLTGIGTNKNSALNNALNDFNPKNKEIKDFYIKTGDKIAKYFESKCDDFISKADSYAKMGKYEDALGLLLSIPNISSNCFNKVKTKSVDVYKLHLNKSCNTLILSAKASYAKRDIDSVIKAISLVDPTSECFVEAKEFLSVIENEMKDKEKEELKTKLKVYQDELELEKLRIAAIKDIALAYYSRNPSTFNYFDITIKK